MDENRRILVIDDDEGIRETYLNIFTPEEESEVLSMGSRLFGEETPSEQKSVQTVFDLSLSDNGSEGIEKATKALQSEQPFAVAFIDMKMPGLNGAQTAQKIWEIDPNIKIVIVTAYSEYTPEDIISVTGRDDIFYLRKPFNHEEIYQFARALTNEWNLERRRALLERELNQTNADLDKMNKTLKEKVRKQTAMIVQTEKMASVGLLAAGVAHEINNPISFINSNLSTAKTYCERMKGLYKKYNQVEQFLADSNSPEAQQLLSDLDRYKSDSKIGMILDDFDDLVAESLEGIYRVKTIVGDLKTFSRVDEVEFKAIDINEAIDTTLNMIHNKFKYKVVVEKKYGDLPLVPCFPQKISQVLMNLLINAGQAIQEKGTVTIETSITAKGRRENDKFVEINISDDGCGIPQKDIDKLFDPFFTTKPVGKGTGLGLSIVYEIIKAHNGTIQVNSKVEEGSRFTVMLPMKRRPIVREESAV